MQFSYSSMPATNDVRGRVGLRVNSRGTESVVVLERYIYSVAGYPLKWEQGLSIKYHFSPQAAGLGTGAYHIMGIPFAANKPDRYRQPGP